MSDTSTSAPPIVATDQDLQDVRDLLREALLHYHHTAGNGAEPVAGIGAIDLADNVRGWTHTTRLRDFVETTRKASLR